MRHAETIQIGDVVLNPETWTGTLTLKHERPPSPREPFMHASGRTLADLVLDVGTINPKFEAAAESTQEALRTCMDRGLTVPIRVTYERGTLSGHFLAHSRRGHQFCWKGVAA